MTRKILYGEKLTDDQLSIYMPFITNKMFYYSGQEKNANLLNHFWSLPKEYQAKLTSALMKGTKLKKWVQKTPAKKFKDVVIRYLQQKYECSVEVARQYYVFLSKEDIKEISKIYE